MFIICLCIWMYCLTYSASYSFFHYQQYICLLRTLSSVILKHECHTNPGPNKTGAGSSLHVSIIYCESFQTYLLVTTYYLEHTDHENHQDFLIQNLSKLLLHVFNRYRCLLYLSYCKSLSYLATMFH